MAFATEGARSSVRDIDDLYRRSRSEGFGTEVKRRIMLGTYVLSAGYYDAYYRKAQQVRTLLRADFESAFERCDLLAMPTSPEVAFPLGEKQRRPDQDVSHGRVYRRGQPGRCTGCVDSLWRSLMGLPVGLQLVGRALDEATLLRVADAFQRENRPSPASAPCRVISSKGERWCELRLSSDMSP